MSGGKPIKFKVFPSEPTIMEVVDVDGVAYELRMTFAVLNVTQRVGEKNAKGHPIFEVQAGVVADTIEKAPADQDKEKKS